MCGLCGMLGVDVHWSDASSTPQAFGGRNTTRRHERARRVAVINNVLGHYAIQAKDWMAMSYVLSTRTGKTRVVDHLGILWAEAEGLAGRPCDPLDPALIEALEARHSGSGEP